MATGLFEPDLASQLVWIAGAVLFGVLLLMVLFDLAVGARERHRARRSGEPTDEPARRPRVLPFRRAEDRSGPRRRHLRRMPRDLASTRRRGAVVPERPAAQRAAPPAPPPLVLVGNENEAREEDRESVGTD